MKVVAFEVVREVRRCWLLAASYCFIAALVPPSAIAECYVTQISFGGYTYTTCDSNPSEIYEQGWEHYRMTECDCTAEGSFDYPPYIYTSCQHDRFFIRFSGDEPRVQEEWINELGNAYLCKTLSPPRVSLTSDRSMGPCTGREWAERGGTVQHLFSYSSEHNACVVYSTEEDYEENRISRVFEAPARCLDMDGDGHALGYSSSLGEWSFFSPPEHWHYNPSMCAWTERTDSLNRVEQAGGDCWEGPLGFYPETPPFWYEVSRLAGQVWRGCSLSVSRVTMSLTPEEIARLEQAEVDIAHFMRPLSIGEEERCDRPGEDFNGDGWEARHQLGCGSAGVGQLPADEYPIVDANVVIEGNEVQCDVAGYTAPTAWGPVPLSDQRVRIVLEGRNSPGEHVWAAPHWNELKKQDVQVSSCVSDPEAESYRWEQQPFHCRAKFSVPGSARGQEVRCRAIPYVPDSGGADNDFWSMHQVTTLPEDGRWAVAQHAAIWIPVGVKYTLKNVQVLLPGTPPLHLGGAYFGAQESPVFQNFVIDPRMDDHEVIYRLKSQTLSSLRLLEKFIKVTDTEGDPYPPLVIDVWGGVLGDIVQTSPNNWRVGQLDGIEQGEFEPISAKEIVQKVMQWMEFNAGLDTLLLSATVAESSWNATGPSFRRLNRDSGVWEIYDLRDITVIDNLVFAQYLNAPPGIVYFSRMEDYPHTLAHEMGHRVARLADEYSLRQHRRQVQLFGLKNPFPVCCTEAGGYACGTPEDCIGMPHDTHDSPNTRMLGGRTPYHSIMGRAEPHGLASEPIYPVTLNPDVCRLRSVPYGSCQRSNP